MQTRSPWPLLALAASFVGGMVARSAYPQNAPGRKIVLVTSMKVPPGKVDKYLELEQKTWKPVHQARIKAGNGRSWSLYAARFPSGTSTSRDYITINVFDSMQELDKYDESLVKVLPQVHPKKTAEQLFGEAVAARDEALNELWIEIDHVDRE